MMMMVINFSSFKLDTENNANFDAEAYRANAGTRQRWRCSVKETKFWSKIHMNVKVTTLGSL